jgi:chromatin segregation and condensation protein Rec8/ScpA/Scc1 (kleisin family)
VELIVDFLAVLELIKTGFLEARQAEAFGEIELLRRDGAAAPPGAEPAEEHRG